MNNQNPTKSSQRHAKKSEVEPSRQPLDGAQDVVYVDFSFETLQPPAGGKKRLPHLFGVIYQPSADLIRPFRQTELEEFAERILAADVVVVCGNSLTDFHLLQVWTSLPLDLVTVLDLAHEAKSIIGIRPTLEDLYNAVRGNKRRTREQNLTIKAPIEAAVQSFNRGVNRVLKMHAIHERWPYGKKILFLDSSSHRMKCFHCPATRLTPRLVRAWSALNKPSKKQARMSQHPHWAIEPHLARSARPGYAEGETPQEIAQWIDEAKALGVKSIICLLSLDELGEYYGSVDVDLLDLYKQSGFTVEHLPVEDYATPPLSAGQIGRIVTLFRHLPKPVLVHCSAGMDRTGMAVAAIADSLRTAH